jgi:tetratricopeptide (TPR) repeat protein
MQYHAERHFHQAWWCYEAAREQEPDSPFVWIARGDLANDLLRFNDALSCYDRALGAVPASPMILERRARTEQNHTKPRSALSKMFLGAPKWTPAVVSFAGVETPLHVCIRLNKKWGQRFATMSRIVELWEDVPKAEEIGNAAHDALVEQRWRPSAFQSVTDELLIYMLQTTHGKNDSEFNQLESTEAVLAWALDESYTCILLGDTPTKLPAHRDAHTDFMRLEARYPGLAEAIWMTRGRKAFESGKIGAALAGDRETLARFHDLSQRDMTAFVESLLAWLG